MTPEQQHEFRNSVCCIFAISNWLLRQQNGLAYPEIVAMKLRAIKTEAMRAGKACGMDIQNDAYLNRGE